MAMLPAYQINADPFANSLNAFGNGVDQYFKASKEREQRNALLAGLARTPGIGLAQAESLAADPALARNVLMQYSNPMLPLQKNSMEQQMALARSAEGRAAAMHPYQIQNLQAQIGSTNTSTALHGQQLDTLRQTAPYDINIKRLAAANAQREFDTPKDNLMKIGPEDVLLRTSPRGGPAEVVYGGATAGPSQKTIDTEHKLRAEYTGNPDVKNYQIVRSAYQNVLNSAKDPSAAGDLSMIFAYMKILDPNSVVREQEFANAQNAAGVPDRIRNVYNRIMSGERLNPEQRQDFINQATKLHETSSRQYQSIRQQMGTIAAGARARPDQVMIDFGNVPEGQKPPSGPNAPQQTPQVKAGTVYTYKGANYLYKGGNPNDPAAWEQVK